MTREEAITELSVLWERNGEPTDGRYREALDMAIDALSAEPCEENLQPTCNQLATDCISRQAAIDAITHELRCGAVVDQCGLETAYDLIKELPSVEPERKKGKWIKKNCDLLYCSECDLPSMHQWPYCEMCGAEMETK